MLKTLVELLFSSEELANYLKWSIQINDGAFGCLWAVCSIHVTVI